MLKSRQYILFEWTNVSFNFVNFFILNLFFLNRLQMERRQIGTLFMKCEHIN